MCLSLLQITLLCYNHRALSLLTHFPHLCLAGDNVTYKNLSLPDVEILQVPNIFKTFDNVAGNIWIIPIHLPDLPQNLLSVTFIQISVKQFSKIVHIIKMKNGKGKRLCCEFPEKNKHYTYFKPGRPCTT